MKFNDLIAVIFVAWMLAIVALSFFLGAWAHEGDIQSACKEDGRTGYATWRGELSCGPVKD